MSLLDPPRQVKAAYRQTADRLFALGHAHGMLIKHAGVPLPSLSLGGRLYVSKSGWLLLSVPNDIVRGLFAALHEPGAELPLKDGKLEAHISVMTKDEVAQIGAENINERGKTFHYQWGPLKTVTPAGQSDTYSKVWFIEIQSPELKALRRTYGLSPLPNGDHELHCTIAYRRKGVLGTNDVSKVAENTLTDGDTTYDVDALLELLRDRPTKTLPLESFQINQSRNTGFSPRRLAAADPSYPGVVDESDRLLDGKHRVVKLKAQGITDGAFRVATKADLDAVKKADATVPDSRPYRDRVEIFPTRGSLVYGGIWPDKTHGVYGGGVEDGESPLQAAQRELMEEAGRTLHDPYLIDTPAMTHEWSPPYQTSEQAERAKKYRGSRTLYVSGRLGDEPRRKPAEPAELSRVQLRKIDTMLEGLRQHGTKSYHVNRQRALEQLRQQLMQELAVPSATKRAAADIPALVPDSPLNPRSSDTKSLPNAPGLRRPGLPNRQPKTPLHLEPFWRTGVPPVQSPAVAPPPPVAPVPVNARPMSQFVAKQNIKNWVQPRLPAGTPFPYGAQVPAMNTVLDTLATDPHAAHVLEQSIHGLGPRGQLMAQAFNRGFQPLPAEYTSPSAMAMYEQRFPMPPRLTFDKNQEPHHNARTGHINVYPLRQFLENRPETVQEEAKTILNTQPSVYVDPAVVAAHETEHALTIPDRSPLSKSYTARGTASRPVAAAENDRYFNDEKFVGPEIPPSLGDIVNQAEVVRRDSGIRLQDDIEIAPGVKVNPEWMRQQAQEHGYFDNKTMTELLATQSGQQWLKQRLQDVRNAQQYTAEGLSTGYKATGNALDIPALPSNFNYVPTAKREKSSGVRFRSGNRQRALEQLQQQLMQELDVPKELVRSPITKQAAKKHEKSTSSLWDYALPAASVILAATLLRQQLQDTDSSGIPKSDESADPDATLVPGPPAELKHERGPGIRLHGARHKPFWVDLPPAQPFKLGSMSPTPAASLANKPEFPAVSRPLRNTRPTD